MADKGSKKKSRKPPSKLRRFLGRFFLGSVITVLVLGIVAVVGVVIAYNTIEIPDPNKDFQTNTTSVVFADQKTEMGTFAVQNRQSIPYKEMPQSIKDAVIAAENRSFWTDPGISVLGMLRAAWAIVTGGEMQGGSTITQQYIKILYLTSDRTMSRKAKELLLAVKLNKEVPKEEILEGYLNTIYFGRGAYGIEAAAQAYFNVPASKLTVQQSAVLASVINSPGIYDPAGGEANVQRLTERYHYVLDGLLEAGKITRAEHDELYAGLPEFPQIPASDRYGGPNGFLLSMVESELIARGLSQAQIRGGGLTIVTTVDKKSQDAAIASAQKYTQRAAEDSGEDPNDLHVAIASIDNSTGGIRALYGGPDFVKNSRNWATTPRMAASTFKTFNLAAGLEDGFTLRSMLRGNTFTPSGDSVPVRNEFNHQYGEVTLRRAMADSINTAFVDLTIQMENGPQKVVAAANKAGVPTGPGWDLNNRIGLGSAEASPLRMALGYSTYANNGIQHTPHIVAEVRDPEGKVIYSAETQGKRTVDEDISRDVTYALQSVVEGGTGSRVAQLGRPVAGKTGTAGVEDEIRTAWFVAYTRQVSTAVMYVAGPDGNGDLDPYKRPGDGTFFGGTYPAMTWLDYMEVATDGMPIEEFDPPANVNRERPKGRQQPQQTQRPRPTETPTTAQPTTPAPTTPAPTTPAPTTPAPTTAPPTTTPPTTAPPTTTPPTTAPPTTTPPTTTPPTTSPPTNAPTNAPGG